MRPKENRALVRGVNVVRRHQQQTAHAGRRHHLQRGAIQISNLALEDPKDGKPTRVGFKLPRRRQEGSLRQALWRDHSGEELSHGRQRETRKGGKARRRTGRQARARTQRLPRAAKAAKAEAGAARASQAASEGLQAAHEVALREGGARGAGEEVRLQEPDAGPAPREDRPQHGRRRGDRGPQEGRQRCRRSRAHRRPEAAARPSRPSRSPPSRCARA